MRLLRVIFSTICTCGAVTALAATFPLPPADESVVGAVQVVIAKYEDTLSDIGRRYGIGYEEMTAANPGIDAWLPGEGTSITVPSQYILPNAPRKGIVVNLPEHRLYYYPPVAAGAEPVVMTYPISVGKMDWNTPLGLTRIVDKRVNPSWTPPESVRIEHEQNGDPLPKVVPPGPDNPLGEYAMRLGIPGGAYLIHGTNKPIAVGMPVTHGCIRMYPEDIERFFKLVPVNTPVRIVQQPLKAGFVGAQLFLEAHPSLLGGGEPEDRSLTDITRALVAATQGRETQIDWTMAEKIFQKASGVPTPLNAVQRSAGVDRLP